MSHDEEDRSTAASLYRYESTAWVDYLRWLTGRRGPGFAFGLIPAIRGSEKVRVTTGSNRRKRA
jgi:hypothetical protein